MEKPWDQKAAGSGRKWDGSAARTRGPGRSQRVCDLTADAAVCFRPVAAASVPGRRLHLPLPHPCAPMQGRLLSIRGGIQLERTPSFKLHHAFRRHLKLTFVSFVLGVPRAPWEGSLEDLGHSWHLPGCSCPEPVGMADRAGAFTQESAGEDEVQRPQRVRHSAVVGTGGRGRRHPEAALCWRTPTAAQTRTVRSAQRQGVREWRAELQVGLHL